MIVNEDAVEIKTESSAYTDVYSVLTNAEYELHGLDIEYVPSMESALSDEPVYNEKFLYFMSRAEEIEKNCILNYIITASL